MNPLCVFFAMFAALSLVRNIIERRKRAQLLRLLVAAQTCLEVATDMRDGPMVKVSRRVIAQLMADRSPR
jgi:hypothetical protein